MKLYKCNISEINEKEMKLWFDAMSSERQSEVMRLAAESKRAAKTAADHLCRQAISEFCNVPAESIEFLKNEFGKPYAKNLPVHFSISHSGDIVACAVSDKEIGIDIEKIRPVNLKAAVKFATENELEYISTNENRFFEIWTLKEAYFKCIGTGLGSDIKDVSFSITPFQIICSESGYNLSLYDMKKEYICAICQKLSD